jgi:hypothetical protein
MNKDAPYFATLTACIFIIVLIIIGALAVSKHEKYFQCMNNPNYWCWNDWKCDKLGATGTIPVCTKEQELAGNLTDCYSAYSVYRNFYTSCSNPGSTGVNCPCAFQSSTNNGAVLCNIKSA